MIQAQLERISVGSRAISEVSSLSLGHSLAIEVQILLATLENMLVFLECTTIFEPLQGDAAIMEPYRLLDAAAVLESTQEAVR